MFSFLERLDETVQSRYSDADHYISETHNKDDNLGGKEHYDMDQRR